MSSFHVVPHLQSVANLNIFDNTKFTYCSIQAICFWNSHSIKHFPYWKFWCYTIKLLRKYPQTLKLWSIRHLTDFHRKSSNYRLQPTAIENTMLIMNNLVQFPIWSWASWTMSHDLWGSQAQHRMKGHFWQLIINNALRELKVFSNKNQGWRENSQLSSRRILIFILLYFSLPNESLFIQLQERCRQIQHNVYNIRLYMVN